MHRAAQESPVSRRHHYFFTHRVLPAVFYDNPQNFLFVLRRDGTDALRASWERVGSDLDQNDRLSAVGLDCEVRELVDRTTLALITLPEPQYSPEAHFAAAVYRAPALVRFFTLESRQPGPDQRPLVCEWLQSGEHQIRGVVPTADLDAFVRSVCEQLGVVPTA